MPRGRSGVINMDCPIEFIDDRERFINLTQHPYPPYRTPDNDVLKMLPAPTVNSSLIKCFYFLEVHI
jgi:hypothetical protein